MIFLKSLFKRPASLAESNVEIDACLEKGRALREKGAWRRAERQFGRALKAAQNTNDRARAAEALHLLAGLRLLDGKVDDAARLAASAVTLYERIGDMTRASAAERLKKTAMAMGARA